MVKIPNRQVIWAGFDRDTRIFDVAYLARNKKKDVLSLFRISGEVQNLESNATSEWVESLMHTCYEGLSSTFSDYSFYTYP